MPKHPSRVREPAQTWLEAPDAELLGELSDLLEVSKAEVLRLGIRRLAADQRPGAAMSALLGALDGDAQVPRDLAERHDEYLYGSLSEDSTSGG
ncbi:MAG: hypothetical protein Q8K82_15790 [Gemmatimonadaceae bacterium]|nr:hypothetical protein [Gemmatimonadaceae bacterium]